MIRASWYRIWNGRCPKEELFLKDKDMIMKKQLYFKTTINQSCQRRTEKRSAEKGKNKIISDIFL